LSLFDYLPIMPAYGPYETTREIAGGHGTVVFSARKTGEPADNYAIKVFILESLIRADEEDRSELARLVEEFSQSFTRSVELQKQASAGSRHVAPILDVGRDEQCVWYATRLYPRTVQKVLEGRAALGEEWIFHIVSSIAAGALDFKRACGRSHGEIKPSYILISASQKSRDAAVVLSDPLPGGAAEAARYEMADLNAIGQIIYQLVRRREIADALDHSILPLQPSNEWTDIFGKRTGDWLKLCNRLLDPNLSVEDFGLEELAQALEGLKPKPPVTGRMLAVAASLTVVVIAGLMFTLRILNRGDLTIVCDPAQAEIQITPLGDAPGGPVSGRTESNGRMSVKLGKGKYSIRATHRELGVQTREVEIRGRADAPVRFTFPYGVLILRSDPPRAGVRIDNTNLLVDGEAVRTPYTFKAFRTGEITIQFDLKEEGYLPTNMPVLIVPGGKSELAPVLAKPPADQVQVEFSSNLRDVEVHSIRLDDNSGKKLEVKLGILPDTRSFLPGRYRFEARYREGWPVQQRELTLKLNDQPKVRFEYVRARLDFDNAPRGATIRASSAWSTNLLLGMAPTNMFWPTGLVTFRFELARHEAASITTNILHDVSLVPEMVTTDGTILLVVEQVPAVVFDVTEGGRKEIARTTPGQTNTIVMPPGMRTYVVEAQYYQTLRTNVDFVTKQKTTKTLRLVAEPVPADFRSEPAGGEIFDPATGKSLASLARITNWMPGTHLFAVRHPRHPRLGTITENVTLLPGRTNFHTFVFPHTTLNITSSPPGTVVYDITSTSSREALGRTPTNLLVRPPARLKLEFVALDGTNKNVAEYEITATGATNVGTRFRPPKPPPYTNSIGMVMEWIPEEKDNGGYWVGKYEVTQPQYEKVMGINPSRHRYPGAANLPADNVSLANALEFCRRLTEMDQSSLGPGTMKGGTYTLPSTNQWSYYAEATLDKAVVKRGRPDSVELLPANDFGLCGVRGNLWEWCLEGEARGQAYDSAPGLMGFQLVFHYALKLQANQPSAFNVGFRCILKPVGGR